MTRNMQAPNRRFVSLVVAAAMSGSATQLSAECRHIEGLRSVDSVRECANPGRLRSIGNDILRNCDVAGLLEILAHNEAVAEYYWCQYRESVGDAHADMDAVTVKLLEGQLQAGKAFVKAAVGALKGPAGAPNTAAALKEAASAAGTFAGAAVDAAAVMDKLAVKDEWFRLYANALHQTGLAEKLIEQMRSRACH